MRTPAALGQAVPLLVCLIFGCQRHVPDPPPRTGLRRLPLSVLEDKIRGGWAGKMIGVTCGAPFEFRSRGAIIEDDLNHYDGYSPEKVEDALAQDDLYVDATLSQVMDEKGL